MHLSEREHAILFGTLPEEGGEVGYTPGGLFAPIVSAEELNAHEDRVLRLGREMDAKAPPSLLADWRSYAVRWASWKADYLGDWFKYDSRAVEYGELLAEYERLREALSKATRAPTAAPPASLVPSSDDPGLGREPLAQIGDQVLKPLLWIVGGAIVLYVGLPLLPSLAAAVGAAATSRRR